MNTFSIVLLLIGLVGLIWGVVCLSQANLRKFWTTGIIPALLLLLVVFSPQIHKWINNTLNGQALEQEQAVEQEVTPAGLLDRPVESLTLQQAGALIDRGHEVSTILMDMSATARRGAQEVAEYQPDATTPVSSPISSQLDYIVAEMRVMREEISDMRGDIQENRHISLENRQRNVEVHQAIQKLAETLGRRDG